jgi:hypothetical protein
VNRRAWHVFWILQAIGCITATYGSVESESAIVRWSWIVSVIFLLPGNFVAMGVMQALWKWTVHIQAIYLFVPLTISSNATLWVSIAFGFKKLALKSK